MGDLSLFIPITKVDATKRLVYGIVTAEIEDRAGEICDYESTKPHYEKWSAEIAESSGGKSLGNLRAMHGQVAAGKITAITFNDVAKQIEICAKVVDDSEWIKVTEGVYTGFSQGGSYERRWADSAGMTRYTAVPNEISLVDLPCLVEARFEMIKTDGTHESIRLGPDTALLSRLEHLVDEIGWIEGLSSEECEDLPDLVGLSHEVRGLKERLLTVLSVIETDSTDHDERRRPERRNSSSHADPNEEMRSRETRVRTHRRSPDDQSSRIHSRNTYNVAREIDADHPARKILQGTLEKRIDGLASMMADVLQHIKNIEQQPLPLPLSGGYRAVTKYEDGGASAHSPASMESMLTDPETLSILAIRLAQRNGRSPLR